MPQEDLRRYVRIARDMVVNVTERHVSKEEVKRVEAMCRNVAEGGVFVELTEPPPKGAIVEIEFVPPHAHKPIRTLGIVRWRSSDPPGIGVKFAPVDASERERLLNLARTAKAQAPPERKDE